MTYVLLFIMNFFTLNFSFIDTLVYFRFNSFPTLPTIPSHDPLIVEPVRLALALSLPKGSNAAELCQSSSLTFPSVHSIQTDQLPKLQSFHANTSQCHHTHHLRLLASWTKTLLYSAKLHCRAASHSVTSMLDFSLIGCWMLLKIGEQGKTSLIFCFLGANSES